MRKRMWVLVIVLIAVIVVVAVVAFWPGAPDIPADHAGRTTCFGCHETGANGAPIMPQWHLDRIQDGTLTDNVTDCLKCHDRASAT